MSNYWPLIMWGSAFREDGTCVYIPSFAHHMRAPRPRIRAYKTYEGALKRAHYLSGVLDGERSFPLFRAMVVIQDQRPDYSSPKIKMLARKIELNNDDEA